MTKKMIGLFSKGERILWCASVMAILISFLWFDRENMLTLSASLIGVTSLLLNAKGHPLGQLLMVIFSILYGVISFSCAYYGEMITYLGMTGPMAVAALVSWLTHPYQGNHAEVAVGSLKKNEPLLMAVLTTAVTVLFYFVLAAFDTAYLFISTISVTTSFLAVYLTFRRSPFFALAYAFNDLVLILLWILASIQQNDYLSVVVCFIMFLINDLYGFICWLAMEKRQLAAKEQR